MNVEQARTNMLKQQMRTWGVLDENILQLMQRIPRESFVPKAFRKLAYADMCIPIGHSQTMLEPKQEANILQALQIQPTETVLEIGTGTGYFTSLLALIAKQVYSVDNVEEFTQTAQKRIDNLNIQNITLCTADGHAGYLAKVPYDVIIFTGSALTLPEDLQHQLVKSNNSRVIAMLGRSPNKRVVLLTHDNNAWQEDFLFNVDVAYLTHAKQPLAFNF